jgi:mono/diheme cytochrome c family protein
LSTRKIQLVAALAVVALTGPGCRQDMHDQPRYEPLEASDFFGDGLSARPLVPGTVFRGGLREGEHLHAGRVDGELAETLPVPLTRELLERGQERFNIYCTPCHGRLGNGEGMVVQRGFPAPRSFHEDRLRQERVGYFFDVMTNGFGRMQDYSAQVPVQDRWAIAAYVRALQLSQGAPLETLSAEDRRKLAEVIE